RLAESLGTTVDRLRRQLRGDVDTIVGTALRADASRRYTTAEALDADLGRLLEGRPIAARPDDWAYRARKFVGRHRRGVAVAALAVATLVTSMTLTVVQARRVAREAARARQV